jgi:hypothetical protein
MLVPSLKWLGLIVFQPFGTDPKDSESHGCLGTRLKESGHQQ